MSTDLSLTNENTQVATKLKHYNTLTTQEKAKVISNILDNMSKGLFNGMLIGGVFYGLSRSSYLAYLTVGYYLGKSYFIAKNDLFIKYQI